jgi:ketosteroid isomerase-like protein
VRDFYAAFARRDGDAMAKCYAADARFADPVFSDLRGGDVGDMWRMLCERASDLAIRCTAADGDDRNVSAKWEADYTFTGTGRKVQNRIAAAIVLDDSGLIERHVDTFDLWKWTRMALGPMGTFLGWSPIVRGGVRKKAMAGLRAWQAKQKR